MRKIILNLLLRLLYPEFKAGFLFITRESKGLANRRIIPHNINSLAKGSLDKKIYEEFVRAVKSVSYHQM